MTSELTILDGGMGQELMRRGAEETVLWSAWALLFNPELVSETHDAYLAAGADILTTNSYATFADRFDKIQIPGDAEKLTRLAGRLARESADAADRDIEVAGSLPPLRNSYNPDPGATVAELEAEYTVMVEHLDDYVDMFICETMGARVEAEAAANAARRSGKPVWVAFTLQGGTGRHLLDGTTFEAAVKAAPAEAYLLNCSTPEQISAALPLLVKAAKGVPVGAYANAFHEMPVGWSGRAGDLLPGPRDDMDAQRHVDVVRDWIEMGATIVGGCCEIGPSHIAAMTRALRPTT